MTEVLGHLIRSARFDKDRREYAIPFDAFMALLDAMRAMRDEPTQSVASPPPHDVDS